MRRLLDTRRTEVFVSGSSAALLSREIASSLRGRACPVLIHPFSFEEACRHRESRFRSARTSCRVTNACVRNARSRTGSALAASPRRRSGCTVAHQLLRDYVDVAILRDPAARISATALETAVLVELERRRLEVTYVRTPQGHEVDFLARGPERRPEFIQVCADLSMRLSSTASCARSRRRESGSPTQASGC